MGTHVHGSRAQVPAVRRIRVAKDRPTFVSIVDDAVRAISAFVGKELTVGAVERVGQRACRRTWVGGARARPAARAATRSIHR